MAVTGQRDTDAVQDGLARWRGAPVTELEQPSSGGMSSDTYLFTAGRERLVARLPPVGAPLLPTHDLGQQAQLMEALAEFGLPVPRVVAYVDDESFVGAPFLVTARVEGRVPEDTPPYLRKGWLYDATPEQQRRLHANFLDVCARIHLAPVPDVGLRRGLDEELAWWREYLFWAADGEPPDVAVKSYDALLANQPTPPPDALCVCWGDLRLPNVVFDDQFAVTGVLDWEMATVGPAEFDVGWMLAIHQRSVETAGGDLPGFPDRAALLRSYEARLGRELHHLGWFERWAQVRIDSIMLRVMKLLRS